MTGRRIRMLAATAVGVALIVIASALALRHDGKRARPAPPGPAPAAKSFNADGLPPIHTDACPAAGDLLPAPATGKDALPDLTLECIGAIGTSDTVELRRLGGVPTVVNLWSTSCDACRHEMPDLQAVYAAAAGKVRIIGVDSKDYAEGARATILNTGVRYPSLADPGEKVRVDVGSIGLPVTLFVSPAGKVVHRRLGAYPDEPAIKADIAEYLGVTL
jgi:thiol-disulfide isomerase/thioredoxin